MASNIKLEGNWSINFAAIISIFSMEIVAKKEGKVLSGFFFYNKKFVV
jgi:hypothetical protein